MDLKTWYLTVTYNYYALNTLIIKEKSMIKYKYLATNKIKL